MLADDERTARLMGFAVEYAYNLGKLENEAITLRVTREVFERGRVSSFTGDVRTLLEIENLRFSWMWMMERPSADGGGFAFVERELLAALVAWRASWRVQAPCLWGGRWRGI